MNPLTNNVTELNLPPPVMNEIPAYNHNTPTLAAVERAPAPVAGITNINSLMPAISLPVPTAPLSPIAQGSVANTTSNANPVVADDADLIEKEWVQKAKDIIKQTQNNPHLQSKELNIFKADYMQKRYNKALKLSE